MTRIIAIGSGQAGVGKSSLAINLAAQLAARGQRVCLLDTGPVESGICSTLAEPAPISWKDFASVDGGDSALTHAHGGGFDVVALGLDEEWAGDADDTQLRLLAQTLENCAPYDFLLIDTTSGIAQSLLAFVLASPELLLLVTTESESLSDAYALLKLVYSEQYEGLIQVVVNKSKNHTVGRYSYDKFREVVDFYLSMKMPLLGIVDDDAALLNTEQTPVLLKESNASSQALRDIDGLAQSLLENQQQAAKLKKGEFAERYLRAAGVTTTEDDDVSESRDTHPNFSTDDDNLYQQLEFLSDQVDSLISEVARLREDEVGDGRVADNDANDSTFNEAALLELRPSTAATRHRDPCSEACIAALANESETVTVQGDTFPIYRIRKPNGEQQRFAFQTIDDDLEEPEPQTTSS